ncbi:hypothetical protein [Streptomyces globisporus]|uniref:hypothetical protein n=1 Tax=Streptomyces globisporus TaxID=1908 RepID=UPI0037CB0B1C
MRRRKNRTPETPEAAQEAPVTTLASSDQTETLRALQERLDRLESGGVEPYNPDRERRRAHAAALAEETRHDADEPCPACGLLGGEQRRTGSTRILPRQWLCVPCAGAVDPGWGSSTRPKHGEDRVLDRLAALAGGMDEPTQDFRALAARYGLAFSLASSPGVTGTGAAWGHLGDLDEWARVGRLAIRRQEAGLHAITVRVAPDDREFRMDKVFDPSSPLGFRWASVPVEADPDEAARQALERDRAALEREEATVERILRDRAREAKEQEAAEQREQRQAAIRAHYLEHKTRLDAEVADAQAALRAQLSRALEAAL